MKGIIRLFCLCSGKLISYKATRELTGMVLKDALREAERRIGERLRETRQSFGLTQHELAVTAGTNQAVIQKIENGHSIRPRILIDLGIVLEVNPAWLQFGNL